MLPYVNCTLIALYDENKLRKSKGLALDIAPQVETGPQRLRGAQVHGVHQAASHVPALYLPSSLLIYRPREDGGLSKPRPRVQRAKSNWPTVATRQPAANGLEPATSWPLDERANH